MEKRPPHTFVKVEPIDYKKNFELRKTSEARLSYLALIGTVGHPAASIERRTTRLHHAAVLALPANNVGGEQPLAPQGEQDNGRKEANQE